RVFGGADVYHDLPPFQAPGAVRGSLCTLAPDEQAPPPRRGRRLPPVYAFDDHAFWLARTAQAAGVPCLVLRAILLEAPADRPAPHPLFQRVISGRLGPALRTWPWRWPEIRDVPRNAARCRSQLASALAVLFVLHERSH
ncbi:MAG TPA: hypothetical protein VKU60_11775, partial [Chloroflexota bacterium]|nr:hypothetical protein [Chloroflexota bacterium]